MSKINLLPPEYKLEIQQAKENKSLRRFLLKTLLLILVVTGLFFGEYFVLNFLLEASSKELQQRESGLEVYGNLENDAKKIAAGLNTINLIDKNSPQWSGIIEEIQNIMPQGVYLTNVKMDSSRKIRNTINGIAATKKEVAALRDLMEDSKKFDYVDIESSSTVTDPKTKRETESFSISFSIEKGAL